MASEEEQRISKWEDNIQGVENMKAWMLTKLSRNMHKVHWTELNLPYLLERAKQEFNELIEAIAEYKHPDEISAECGDISNFLMMIMQNYRRNYNAEQSKSN